jgi:NDP-sugar pyrophosphorylase family protein
MNKPILVVMAAGLGSRYGGAKQIEGFGSNGEIIAEFSLFDAHKAGFETAVFIANENNEGSIREKLDGGAGRHLQIDYVHQHLDDLPDGYSLPEGRVKPWGTAHAVYAARAYKEHPMVIINADDYYGPEAFRLLYDFLSVEGRDSRIRGNDMGGGEIANYAMAGYRLDHTLSDSGHVARGVCRIDGDGYLLGIDERTKIERRGSVIEYTEDGFTWIPLPEDSLVSLNCWGFAPGFIDAIEGDFPAFLDSALKEDPLKKEFWLPKVVDGMIRDGNAKVSVLPTNDTWYGVTYPDDKAAVVEALKKLKDSGVYPDSLWA